MRRVGWIVSVFLVALTLATPARTETPEEKGLAIAKEADRRGIGYRDSTAEMVMTLRNRHGEESKRFMEVRGLEILDDGDKSLITFEHPADVKNTALLTFSHKFDPDDQWLYLPAVKRVKRISSTNKSGPFMGSEFAYEDLSDQEIEKYAYRYLTDETIDGMDCFVIERVPVYEHSGYTRQIVWLDKAEHRIWKVDYYDRKNSLLKTLTFRNYHLYLDKYWRSHEMEMVNHQTGKSTLLLWDNIRFQTGLTDGDFTKSSLMRGR
ncbi:MAG: outer membrane lipoprotein-sorting protein [Alphaproteobacteria bacterium]|nr:outer membrane lipoprotein-sorting protein [Alphaproteobacteria bacterium]